MAAIDLVPVGDTTRCKKEGGLTCGATTLVPTGWLLEPVLREGPPSVEAGLGWASLSTGSCLRSTITDADALGL